MTKDSGSKGTTMVDISKPITREIKLFISGGLGNQLFQFAFGYSLSKKLNIALILDRSFYEKVDNREYLLGKYKIKNTNISLLSSFPNRLLPKNYQLVKETNYFTYDEKLVKRIYSIKHVYLKGYFQCPRYFEEYESEIRSIFILKHKPDKANQSMLAKINSVKNSVALHIRRGDYANDPIVRANHGLLELDYYFQAIDILKSKFNQYHFFIFSDEPEWAKTHLKLGENSTIVDINPANKGFEDIRLMQYCQNFIIANSSFSWWGAWLSDFREKIVIAPQTWLAGANHSTEALIPDTWIRI